MPITRPQYVTKKQKEEANSREQALKDATYRAQKEYLKTHTILETTHHLFKKGE